MFDKAVTLDELLETLIRIVASVRVRIFARKEDLLRQSSLTLQERMVAGVVPVSELRMNNNVRLAALSVEFDFQLTRKLLAIHDSWFMTIMSGQIRNIDDSDRLRIVIAENPVCQVFVNDQIFIEIDSLLDNSSAAESRGVIARVLGWMPIRSGNMKRIMLSNKQAGAILALL